MGRTSVRSKTGLSERAGKRRNERSKRQERFKNGNFTGFFKDRRNDRIEMPIYGS